jgi:hypothetical protein
LAQVFERNFFALLPYLSSQSSSYIKATAIQAHFLDLPLSLYPWAQGLKLFEIRRESKIIQDKPAYHAEFLMFSVVFNFDLL